MALSFCVGLHLPICSNQNSCFNCRFWRCKFSISIELSRSVRGNFISWW